MRPNPISSITHKVIKRKMLLSLRELGLLEESFPLLRIVTLERGCLIPQPQLAGFSEIMLPISQIKPMSKNPISSVIKLPKINNLLNKYLLNSLNPHSLQQFLHSKAGIYLQVIGLRQRLQQIPVPAQ